MKTQFLIYISLFLISIHCDAQNLLEKNNDVERNFNIEFGYKSFFNVSEITYLANIASMDSGIFSSSLNFRLEDELLSDETYVLLKDMTFLDVQFNVALGALQLGLFIENLLGFNNSDFAIEPVLDRDYGTDMVYFTHEPNFLVGVSIVYNF